MHSPRPIPQTLTAKHGAVAALLVVVIFGVVRDVSMLFSYPVAVGTDGYYYVLQVRELHNHGHLYYPTGTPFVFYLLTGLSVLTGDSILAIKLGSIAFHALLGIGIYALLTALTHNRWLGVLGCALAALSAMHFYMIAEFIKNLGAITFLIWSAWAAIRASESESRRRVQWYLLSATLFVAALLSHKSAWAVAFALTLLSLLLYRFESRERSSRTTLRRYAPLILVVIFLAIIPALVAQQTLVEIPAWIGKEILGKPEWPLSFTTPVGKVERLVLLIVAPLFLVLTERYRELVAPRHFKSIVGAVGLWSLLVTLNPFLNHDVKQLGVVGRLDHLMYIQLAVLVPGLIWVVQRTNRRATFVVLALTLVITTASLSASLPKGLQPRYLFNRTQMIAHLPALRAEFDANSQVIAAHGDEFIVTWLLGMDARQSMSPSSQSKSIYWLLHYVEPSTLTPSISVVMEQEGDWCMVLVRHGELSQWINAMSEPEKYHLLAQNPHLKKYLQTPVQSPPQASKGVYDENF
ncbi:MAG TPA: glycosyltransferase family 39 protein [Pyrinomonadaceae bacterium]